MSLRAVGEGHISSIEFRTGVDRRGQRVRFDPLGARWSPATAAPPGTTTSRSFAPSWSSSTPATSYAWSGARTACPDRFTLAELEQSLARWSATAPHAISFETAKIMRVLAASSYVTTFPATPRLSERVIFPAGPARDPRHGGRALRPLHRRGRTRHLLRHLHAFDGYEIIPQLIQTGRLRSLPDRARSTARRAEQGHGALSRAAWRALRDAVAPRSREPAPGDVGRTSALDRGHRAAPPQPALGAVQIGNCGSPIETAAGWLVVTHGVGPMRRYVLGALLLDLDDPRRVIGQLREPLLAPDGRRSAKATFPTSSTRAARMANGDDLVLPYGLSDGAVGSPTSRSPHCWPR
jgi:hypothetical protein